MSQLFLKIKARSPEAEMFSLSLDPARTWTYVFIWTDKPGEQRSRPWPRRWLLLLLLLLLLIRTTLLSYITQTANYPSTNKYVNNSFVLVQCISSPYSLRMVHLRFEYCRYCRYRSRASLPPVTNSGCSIPSTGYLVLGFSTAVAAEHDYLLPFT